MATWLDIPEEIWRVIFMKLPLVTDHVPFSRVCKQWRSIVMEYRSIHITTSVPGLVIQGSTTSESSNFSQTRPFLAYPVGKKIDQQPPHDDVLPILSIPHEFRCLGSYQGWLVLDDGPYLSLHNPLTGKEICLPRITYHDGMVVTKVILSTSPTASECVAAVLIKANRILFCKVGRDIRWRRVDCMRCDKLVDGIFYDGRFYVVDILGKTQICEGTQIVDAHEQPYWSPDCSEKRYLVELDGKLLQLVQIVESDSNSKLAKFKVFKLHPAADAASVSKWIEVTDLDGGAIFIGTNQSFALTSSNLMGYEGDRIYHSDSIWDDDQGAMGVFCVRDKTSEPLYFTNSVTTKPHPIWITPMPYYRTTDVQMNPILLSLLNTNLFGFEAYIRYQS